MTVEAWKSLCDILTVVLLGFTFLGRWPTHRPRRFILAFEKLCPVHRGLIAMSGWVAYPNFSNPNLPSNLRDKSLLQLLFSLQADRLAPLRIAPLCRLLRPNSP
jgi:hypothetical protein